MEENEYRKTYRNVNEIPCAFEKAILANHLNCQNCIRLSIAERAAAGCESAPAQEQCTKLLDLMRENAKFTLHLTSVTGKLPHAKEIKVQAGGMLGLQQAVSGEENKTVDNVFKLLLDALKIFGSFEQLPFSRIAQSIAHFEGRPKRRRDR